MLDGHWLDMALRIQPSVAILPVLGFVITYAWKGQFWKTPIGRYMMGFMVGILIVLLTSIILRFFPNWHYRKFVGFICWNIVIGIMSWSFVTIFRVLVLKNYTQGRDD